MNWNIARVACLVYWFVLTAGLLHPDGGRVAGACVGLGGYPDLSHLLAFVTLATLVDCARLAWNRKYMIGTLVAYAIATEAVQFIIPGRTANLVDGAANVAGIATGLAVLYVVRIIVAHRSIQC